MNPLKLPDTFKQPVVSRARDRLLWRTPLRLRQDKVPTVDVLLPCCGENLDVIGSLYVLDDDNSIQVEGLVRELRRWGSRLTPVEIVYGAR